MPIARGLNIDRPNHRWAQTEHMDRPRRPLVFRRPSIFGAFSIYTEEALAAIGCFLPPLVPVLCSDQFGQTGLAFLHDSNQRVQADAMNDGLRAIGLD
jgi:hypothetical protein